MKVTCSNLLDQKAMADIWKTETPHQYEKFGKVRARQALKRENIVTTIDGEKETENVANPGDIIVTNPGGEQYCIKQYKFNQRYSGPGITGLDQEYDAKGTCFAFQYEGAPIQFLASWGERIICNTGDWICSIDEIPDGDIYRVEKNVFEQTYRRI